MYYKIVLFDYKKDFSDAKSMILTRHCPNSSIIIRWHSSAPAFSFLASMPRAKRHRHVACTTLFVKNLNGWLKKKKLYYEHTPDLIY